MQPALLIVDLTNDYFELENLKEKKENLIESTNELTSFARSKNIPVIWIRQEVKEDLSDAPKLQKQKKFKVNIMNTEGAQLLEGLKTESSDIEITKTRFSAFFETKLEAMLHEHDIDTLVIGGVSTHACIHMTAMDAYQRDFNILLAEDCIASSNQEYHDVFWKYQTDQKMLGYSNVQIKEYLMSQGVK